MPRLSLLALVALLPACAGAQRPAARPAPAPFAHADTAALHHTLDSLADAHHGVVGYVVRNIDTGEHLERRADETFPTASLIKSAILVTLYDLREQGKLSLDDPVSMLKIDQVPGSGTLQFMQTPMRLTLGDASWLMATISDNTGTNLVLDKVDIRNVWKKMEALGLPHTKVFAKVFKGSVSSVAPDSTEKYGLGVTTPNEMATLYALMAQGKAVSPAADSAMLEVLAHNEDDQLLQRYVSGVRAPHKTGAVNDARTECTIWYLQSRVVACVLTKENQDQRWILDSEPQLTMARMGKAIVDAWPRKAAQTAAQD